ncbi:MAG: 2-amino-4-hydroxy-6-hydroxymethyldihydropteridine diphosphokinase [Pseudomonadota bacterium]
MTRWVPCYVAIGCNVGDCAANFRRATDALDTLPETLPWRRSRVFRTKPVGGVAQADYFNAVLATLTRLSPDDLLTQLQRIEADAGRCRRTEQRWGPRSLDLDLLVYGAVQRGDTALTLPHPRMAERNFVLLPLAELAPDLVVPRIGHVARLARRCTDDGMQWQRNFEW